MMETGNLDIIEKMMTAVLDGEENEAMDLAKRAIEEDMDLVLVMEEGFLRGIRRAGDLYAEGEYYLPELVCSADAMKAALSVLDPVLQEKPGGAKAKGRILLATVEGDIHDIGKTIVGAMLTAAGYEVQDLGADVASRLLVDAVRERRPDVLGLSALLTSTMEEQRKVIGMLEEGNLRENIKVIVGGAPASHDWARRIGADGYSDNAISAVRLVDELLGTAVRQERS